MIILTIRTDKPEAEIGLFNDRTQLGYETWLAHRQLAETVHQKIETLLRNHHKTWHNIEGIVCYQGPGSFTGLRIGLTTGNTLAYSLAIPIVATVTDNWTQTGIQQLLQGDNQHTVQPAYGSPVHITPPKQ